MRVSGQAEEQMQGLSLRKTKKKANIQMDIDIEIGSGGWI